MAPQLIVLIPYFLLLFVGLTIPSDGQHSLFNPKSLAFVASMIVIPISQLLRGKMTSRQWNFLLFFCAALLFLITWFFWGASSGNIPLSVQVDEFKVFLITLTFPIMTVYLIDSNYLTLSQFYKAVIYSSFIYVLVKCVLVTFHLLGWVNIWKIIEFTGVRTMKMGITETLSRLQTSADVFTPFLVLFVLQADRLKVKLSALFRNSYLFLALASTFLSFSRYLIAIYAISLFLHCLTLNAKKTILNMLFGSLLVLAAVLAIGPGKIQQIIELRVFSKNTFLSDSVRKSQIRAMTYEIEESPFLGKGLGAYAKDYVRDSKLKYSYEVQWVALLMQFGLIGITLILLPLGYIGYRILYVSLPFLILYFLWIFSGFTNPFLLSLPSGILYTCFYLLPESYCDKTCPSHRIESKPK